MDQSVQEELTPSDWKDFWKYPSKRWQARRDLNPQPAVLETAALPIELLAFGTG